MCLSSPSVPAPPPPPQASKQPDAAGLQSSMKRNRGPMSSGSLLTGPGGLTAPVTTGKTSLLGG